MKKFSFLIALLGLPALAFAQTATTSSYVHFLQMLSSWCSGWVGVALATALLLFGSAVGVAKCSPMPSLSGVFGAALLHWGPAILLNFAGVPAPQPAPAHIQAAAATVKPSQVAVTHTVSAPVSAHSGAALKDSSFNTSGMTKWLGLGGAAILASLLALLGFLSTRRKSSTNASKEGNEVGNEASATSAVFDDPNGFQPARREAVLA